MVYFTLKCLLGRCIWHSAYVSANSGAAAGGILFFCTYIPYFFIQPQYHKLGEVSKILACLDFNMAMAFGAQVISMFEGTGLCATQQHEYKLMCVLLHWTKLDLGLFISNEKYVCFKYKIIFRNELEVSEKSIWLNLKQMYTMLLSIVRSNTEIEVLKLRFWLIGHTKPIGLFNHARQKDFCRQKNWSSLQIFMELTPYNQLRLDRDETGVGAGVDPQHNLRLDIEWTGARDGVDPQKVQHKYGSGAETRIDPLTWSKLRHRWDWSWRWSGHLKRHNTNMDLELDPDPEFTPHII